MTRNILAVLACLTLGGCAGAGVKGENRYDGDMPRERIAILKVGQAEDIRNDIAISYRGLQIGDVDGSPAWKGRPAFTQDYVNEIWLLPGEHKTRLHFKRNAYSADAYLKFTAEAGRTYVGKYDFVEGSMAVRIWIEDAETGRPVGGLDEASDVPKVPTVLVCHQGSKKKTLQIPEDTLETHLGHGDRRGQC